MSNQESRMVSNRLKLLGLEVVVGSLVILALVVYIWALNQGSALQTIFLWMAIILVALSIAGVQIMIDARRLTTSGR